jgi:ketosteroid isomerase-like protein
MPTMTATAPADVILLFAEALHDGRLDDAVTPYEPEAVFIPEPGAAPLRGLDAIRAALAGFTALRPTLTPDICKVAQAGDIATVLNAWTLDGTAPDGTSLTLRAPVRTCCAAGRTDPGACSSTTRGAPDLLPANGPVQVPATWVSRPGWYVVDATKPHNAVGHRRDGRDGYRVVQPPSTTRLWPVM